MACSSDQQAVCKKDNKKIGKFYVVQVMARREIVEWELREREGGGAENQR